MRDLSAFSLEGRTIMVTGANTGIGQGIALAVGRAGGRVIGVGRSSLTDTASLLAEMGADFEPVASDLGNAADAQAMFDRVWDRHG
ncbi:SDR family NAD(P)-dependent oxidoreductase, partial [Rhizobiaceae sp. 2RAB30]